MSCAVLIGVFEWVIVSQLQTLPSPHPAIMAPVWSKCSFTKLLTDRVTVLSTLCWLCSTVIFVILLWWIDVCLCRLDWWFFIFFSWLFWVGVCILMPTSSSLLECFIFLWLEKPNQCPGGSVDSLTESVCAIALALWHSFKQQHCCFCFLLVNFRLPSLSKHHLLSKSSFPCPSL